MTKAEQQVICDARQELAQRYYLRGQIRLSRKIFYIVQQCPTLTIATPYAWGVMWRQAWQA